LRSKPPIWSTQQAQKTYNVEHWGEGYFDINDKGHMVARLAPHVDVDLYELVEQLHQKNLTLPVLARFTDLLTQRISRLNQAFEQAIQSQAYNAGYTAVYPIKVNQQASIVEAIVNNGQYTVGLEAGSKTELMIVLAKTEQDGGIIVCNGYKDREYIRLALIGRRLGHRIFIVIEKQSELDLVLRESETMGIQPLLGIRARMSIAGSSKWQNTGGDKSKFGFTSAKLLSIIEQIQRAGQLPNLKLLHFHLGSQIANLTDIEQGATECSRTFTELSNLGVALEYLDIGGGLSVDYDGTQSRNYFSMNYTMEEYAERVVTIVKSHCDQAGLAHPHLITESGRAMTAHHAVLITNVLDVESTAEQSEPQTGQINEYTQKLHDFIKQAQSGEGKLVEIHNRAKHHIEFVHQSFLYGTADLETKALCEQLYNALCQSIKEQLNPTSRTHREVLDILNEKLADKYFCNMSVFQSLPDVWAINQVFPIAPLQRLDEKPTRRGTLHDITCDSDGRIDHYVDFDGVESSLPLHEHNGEPYYLGIFLVGAYQEILGDMHNLFGDTHSINVTAEGDHYRLHEAVLGDSTSYILNHIHFNPDDLLQIYTEKVKHCITDVKLQNNYLKELENGLRGYSYLED